jgi:hypothetical protein
VSEQISSERIRERVLSDAKQANLELTDVEQEALDRACYLATVVEELDRVIAEEGSTTKGPGGIRMHPGFAERRNTIALMHRLIDSIQLDPTKVGETPEQTGRRHASKRGHPAKPRRGGN